MNDMIIGGDSSLWFMEETYDVFEGAEGQLAEEIFSLADKRMDYQRKKFINSIMGVSPIVAELVKGLEKNETFKVVFSDEVRQKLKDGTYHFMKSNKAENLFKAIVVDSNNKIRANADLKLEEVCKGVDPTQLSLAMQGMAIKNELREIAEQLEEMNKTMDAILIGQHNDRLANYYSGEALYREALVTTDDSLKKQLSSAALTSLTNAVSELQVTLATYINDIFEKYDKDKEQFVGIKSGELKKKMFLINTSFQTIHKAMTLKAAIYYQEEEYKALTTVLSEYQGFLERSLTEEKAHVLFLADPLEKDLAGIWNIRQNELPVRIAKTKELLNKKEDYVLEIKREELL